MPLPKGPPPDPWRRRCSVCRSPIKAQVHALMASGMTLQSIHDATAAMGHPHKRQTLGAHIRICLGGRKPLLDEATAQAIADGSAAATTQAEIDFAVLVQRRATELLQAGDMRVSASHGLAAQALIDRRLEKQADRDVSLNMARLLSGAISMVPVTVIESRGVRLLDDGLAPEGVFEPVDA